jgi:acid phosphatase type 7
MPGFRDSKSPRGTWLRTLIVLGLVVAIVAESPLRAVGVIPAWLTLDSTSTVAGSLSPSPGAPDEAESAVAAKRKGDKQGNGTDKSDQKAKKSDKRKGGKTKHPGEDKDRHPGGGNGKHQRNGKRDTPQLDKGQGDKEVTQERKEKDKKSPERRGAADVTAADVTAAATSLSFTPVADAQVSEANRTTNYGTLTQLTVDGGADPDVNSYLRFSVSGVSGTVQSAKLRLWVQASGGTQDGPFVKATGTGWSETGITWRNRPGTNGGVLDDKGALSNGTWVEYTVTRAVKGNGAVGFVLRPESNDGAIFDSREGTNKPQLVITLAGSTPAPTPTPTPTPGPNPTPTPTPTPPTGTTATLLAAGDIAGCSSSGDEATAKLLDGLAGTIATLGDNVYDSGTASEFSTCYAPSWGRHKSRTKPAPGNHDYLTSGASGYFGYFGAAAGESTKGYYSYTLGAWHIVVLNSNCSQAGGCGAGSPQETWLKNDLAAHPTTCTLAYWHHPHFSFGNYSTDTRMQALWQALEAAGAELVLSGHDHNYQRWAPQTWSGTRDPARGIREFVVGTGGKNHYPLGSPPPNVEKANDDTFGILQLTLRPTSYDWQFVPEAGKTFTDTGSGTCH